jgi:heme oxygenase
MADQDVLALPAVTSADEALRLGTFTPYGSQTGAMWAAFRRATRAHALGGGDVAAMVRSARGHGRALADWCRAA